MRADLSIVALLALVGCIPALPVEDTSPDTDTDTDTAPDTDCVPTDEVCDGVDNDCDGLVDGQDDSVTGAATWYADTDSDGHGDAAAPQVACEQPDGFVATDDDCDDTDPALGGDEVCDDVDNDCDGLVDGQDDSLVDATTWYLDADQDGYGGDETTVGCTQPPDSVANSDDCDDGNSAVSPADQEVCDGVDNDCDGLTDGQDDDVLDAETWYDDVDGDGWGDPATAITACEHPSGYVANDDDCDDANAAAGGGAEVCDDIDNDCDGLTDGSDDSVSGTANWYADDDRDGLGDPSDVVEACNRPTGYVADDGDCDDTDATRGGDEVCDDVDNDCDGLPDGQDDSLTGGTRWYQDADEDGLGNVAVEFFACTQPHGYVGNASDCDDTDAASGACAVADDGSICASQMGTDDGSVPSYTGTCDTTAGFQAYGDHCYYTVSSTANWPTARASCIAAGGYLATIADEGEALFVQSINGRPHIGGCDAGTEGTWEWVTGEPFSYSSWSPGEPNDMGGEDCLELAYSGNAWNDIWCSSNPYTAGYVCEFE